MFGCHHDSNSKCKCGNCDVEYLQDPSECYCCSEFEGWDCVEALESEIVVQDVAH